MFSSTFSKPTLCVRNISFLMELESFDAILYFFKKKKKKTVGFQDERVKIHEEDLHHSLFFES